MTPIVRAEDLGREYRLSSHTVTAVSHVGLIVEPGTMVAIHGLSGSGKTTLLNLIGGLDKPTSGNVWLDGTDLTTATDAELVEFRRHKIGFVFQAFGLLPILTATENVQFPMR